MSHSKELLDTITKKLTREYPPSEYEYVFERQLKGTRMMPDVLVRRGGCPVCAVEIGYTRPEKLTAYRNKLHIPDVRWYDKQGVLHADVCEKVVALTVRATPLSEVAVYYVWDRVPCIDCDTNDSETRRVPERCYDRFVRRFGHDAAYAREMECYEYERIDVWTCIITDYIKAWFPSNCDKCGKDWLANPVDEADVLAMELDNTPRNIGLSIGARQLMSWDEARELVAKTFGLSIDYLDGEFINPDEARDVQKQIHVALDRARSA